MLTAIACSVSLLHFESAPGEGGMIFGTHAIIFIVLGALWFHLFGRPALAGRFGAASQLTLDRERAKFRAESM